MSFIDINHGYIADSNANFYYTSDGGSSWSIRNKPTPVSNCSQIYFINQNVGFWSNTPYNYLPRTIDGGNTWQLGGFIGYQSDIFFINNTGWVAQGNHDYMAYTSDSGDTWSYTQIDTGSTKSAIHFSDINNGCIAGYKGNNGIIWRTTNGASTWNNSFTLTGTSFKFKDVFCVNSTTIYSIGYSVTEGSIFAYTTNGGTSWNTKSIPGLTDTIGMWFTDVNTGWVCDTINVTKTTDGGVSWTTQVADAGSKSYHGIQMIDSQNGYLNGSASLYKTTTGGDSVNT